MGKGAGKRRKRGGKQKSCWVEFTKENELFQSYYKAQKIVPDGEWDDFLAALRRELSSTFRITGSTSHAKPLQELMKKHFLDDLKDITVDGVKADPPKSLDWYPNELAWQVNLSRNFIRKSGKVNKFHQFLVEETEQGHVSRQEAVSMIPPILMDIQPEHKILDLCAAPGSKTAQIIEMLHEGAADGIPDGLCVANDVQNRRCYMLVHQSKRLRSPMSVITNLDAALYPSLTTFGENNEKVPLKFDRVLCDVPCSSDGTLRKNPLLWHKWTPHLGVGLHRLQLRILVRGAELIGVGGKVVYSTCSLNPVEDEAVVTAMLQKAKGSLELVDCSSFASSLKRTCGLYTWKIWSKSGKEMTAFQGSDNTRVEHLKETMWPPTEEVAKQLHLERCMRVLPHHQDTGGFFIAVLEKKDLLPWENPETGLRYFDWNKRLPWEDERLPKFTSAKQTDANCNEPKPDEQESSKTEEVEKEEIEDEAVIKELVNEVDEVTGTDDVENNETDENKDVADSPPTKKRKFQGFKEDPYFFLKEDDPHWPQIKEFYGITDSFPVSQLMVRSQAGQKRNIYLCSKAARDMVHHADSETKVVNTGVRLFERCSGTDIPCDFRISQEGVYTVVPFITRRKVFVTQKDILTLLEEGNPFIHKFSDQAQKELNNLGEGCIVLVYEMKKRLPEETVITDLYICAWRAKVSVRILLSKQDKIHHLLMCGQVEKCFKEERPRDMRDSIKSNSKTESTEVPSVSEDLIVPANVNTEVKSVMHNPSDISEDKLRSSSSQESLVTEKTDEEVDNQVANMSDPEIPEGSIDVGFV